jgi:hypothetical protein
LVAAGPAAPEEEGDEDPEVVGEDGEESPEG